jgi:hypothetical protein
MLVALKPVEKFESKNTLMSLGKFWWVQNLKFPYGHQSINASINSINLQFCRLFHESFLKICWGSTANFSNLKLISSSTAEKHSSGMEVNKLSSLGYDPSSIRWIGKLWQGLIVTHCDTWFSIFPYLSSHRSNCEVEKGKQTIF